MRRSKPVPWFASAVFFAEPGPSSAGVAAPLSYAYSARCGDPRKGDDLLYAAAVTQHSSLTLARWSRYAREQQILMIAAEMNRAGKLFGPGDRVRLANAYERVLRLADLTAEAKPSPSLRRELLRWRELAGAVYLEPDEERHRALFRALLLLTPESAKQVPFLLGGRRAVASFPLVGRSSLR